MAGHELIVITESDCTLQYISLNLGEKLGVGMQRKKLTLRRFRASSNSSSDDDDDDKVPNYNLRPILKARLFVK